MSIFNIKILLGSGSPRRKQLIQEMGFTFRTSVSKTDEIPLKHLVKGDIPEYLAKEKANALINDLQDDELLITADTIVWIGSSALNKPANFDEAFTMLKLLNGNVHSVFTGVCIKDKVKTTLFHVESKVYFKKLSDSDLMEYIEIYKPFDKAGSYGAQECLPQGVNPCSERENNFMTKYDLGKLFQNTLNETSVKKIPLIDHIEGSYFNVMGLPVAELIEEIEKNFKYN